MNKEMLERAIGEIPHYGELWEKKIYANPERPVSIVAWHPAQASNAMKAPRFQSQIIMITNHGPLTISFDIEAKDIHEAGAGWKAAAIVTLKKAVEEMEKAEKRIVVPGSEIPFPKNPVTANH